MKVKLCGFSDQQSVVAAVAAQADFIGFVFYEKSPRYIALESASILARIIPTTLAKVAVLVDPDFEFLAKISQKFSPDFFQFHGNENINFLREVRKRFPQIKIIKAFRISEAVDLEHVKNFEDVADLFLLDSAKPGSGKSFKWEMLKNFSTKKNWFLSGGLNAKYLDEALEISGAKMIDISSGIEKYPGQKSPELIQELITKVKNFC